MQLLKPRVGSRSFRLRRETLHTINLCRHSEYVDAIRYLQSLALKERCEVYGGALVWLIKLELYDTCLTFRHEVWSSDLIVSQAIEATTMDNISQSVTKDCAKFEGILAALIEHETVGARKFRVTLPHTRTGAAPSNSAAAYLHTIAGKS